MSTINIYCWSKAWSSQFCAKSIHGLRNEQPENIPKLDFCLTAIQSIWVQIDSINLFLECLLRVLEWGFFALFWLI